MKLKKLHIIGFKSFADKTEIVFDEGVTCVVGPNGCGKSNISDSIRWVLGERSAKMLRGSSMEDVIFNGTDFRKPTALAEVSLTIDNSDRGLPIEYQEVTLTRRLYRNGDSEYLINKTICRLKDIQDLILDTGIGSNSYSMIEQGRIDYILSAGADERRFLIEEAAGISKYKTKKEEAIRKLERTEANRLRLNDIIQEVHKNIQYAEKQARRAERYKEQFERLKKLEIQKAFYDLAQIQEQKAKLESDRSESQNLLAQIEEKIKSCRNQQAVLNETLRGILDKFAAEDGRRHQLQSRIEQIDQQLRFHQEKRMEMANRRGEIQQDLKQTEEKKGKNKAEETAKQAEVAALIHEKEQSLAALRTAEQNQMILEESFNAVKGETEKIKRELFDAASEAAQLRRDYHRLSAFLETGENQQKKHAQDGSRIQDEIKKWEDKSVDCDRTSQSLSEKLDSLNAALKDLQRQQHEQNLEFQRTQNEEKKIQKEQQENQTRLVMLQEIEAAFIKGESDLLGDDLNLQQNLTQSLHNLLKIRPGYEWAVEAALESFTRGFVTENAATAHEILLNIIQKRPNSFNLLVREGHTSSPLSPMTTEPIQHPAILCPLSEAVEITNGYESLLKPFFHQVYVVDDLTSQDKFIELFNLSHHARFLSKDGLMLGPDKHISIRNTHYVAEENIFQRRSEISNLQTRLAALEESHGMLRQEQEKIQSKISSLLAQQKDLESEQLDCRVQKESLESVKGGTQERVSSLKKDAQLLIFQTEELNQQFDEARRQCSSLETKLSDAERREKELTVQLDAINHKKDALDHQKTSILTEVAEKRAAFLGIEERSKFLNTSLELLAEQAKEASERIQTLHDEIQRIEQKEQSLLQEDALLNQERYHAEELRRQHEVALELIRQEKERAETELSQAQDSLQLEQQEEHKFQEALHQVEIKSIDMNYQDKTIHERLQQTYHIRLADYDPAQYPLEANYEDLGQTLAELSKKVETLGTVNLLAIEEYEELKQRYDFLMTQQKDLDDARDTLMETIRKINRTTKTLFETTLENVQKAFQDYYQTLFRGGYAKLILVDEANPLESGIDVVVRPPGKKLQHISLLSGGEKALTAIALLFALFKIKPSPFCVLDEVDAPLDEANVDRFLTVLKTFLDSTQFIIVTHNRKTIGMGDSLYGVTMQEPGISKLVSVKVSHEGVEASQDKEKQDMPDAKDELLSATEGEEVEA